MRRVTACLAQISLLWLVIAPHVIASAPTTATLPQGTRIYVRLDEKITGLHAKQVGRSVRSSVWRDVVVNGAVVVKAGSPVVATVDSIKRSGMVGIRGKMSIAAYETTAVDGQTVQLSGGYKKEGKDRIALSIVLAAVVFWPCIFIPGKAATLPEGMIYDALTGPGMNIQLPAAAAMLGPTADMSAARAGFSAEVLLDGIQREEKPKAFQIQIHGEGSPPTDLVIDSVNGQAIAPLPLMVTNTKTSAVGYTIRAEIGTRKLFKHFQQGINRFEIAHYDSGERAGREVMLNVQM